MNFKKLFIRAGWLLLISGILTELLANSAFSIMQAPVWPTVALGERQTLNGWVANFNPRAALHALRNDARHLDEVSVFGVAATPHGHLAVETDFLNTVLRVSRQLNPTTPVLLTVANIRPHHEQDRWLIRHWLGTPENRAQHIQDLLKLVGRFDGLDIDYENLGSSDGARFEAFLLDLGQALHARGKILTVTIEHQTLMESAIKWERLNPVVDRVRVMAYPYHYERTLAGAVSPPLHVERLAKRALEEIPAEKLEIALPLYGIDWTGPGKGRTVPSLARYKALTHRHGAHVFRDPRTHAARIHYVVIQGTPGHYRRVHHQVWFEDPESAAYKVQMLRQMGILHIGIWQIGAGGVTELVERIQPTTH